MEDGSHSKFYCYHCFIAHSSSDRSSAVELYHLLTSHGLNIFLDAVSLNPGDLWDERLLNAQNLLLMTLILISSKSNSSYYQKEEIAEAINIARKSNRRFIPIYLEGENSNFQIPYGLRRVQGLYNEIGLKDIATKLVNFINNMDTQTREFRYRFRAKKAYVENLERVIHEKTSTEFKNLLNELEKVQTFALKDNVNACLIFFDVDGMTQINKKYGQFVGDLVINKIEDLFCKSIEGSMVVVKLGTDEFVSFGLDCSLELGMKLASDICSSFSKYSWDTIAQDLRVTASFGVSRLLIEGEKVRPGVQTIIYGETVNEWIVRAIFGSRNAKKEGGNRVVQGPLVLPENISLDLNLYIS